MKYKTSMGIGKIWLTFLIIFAAPAAVASETSEFFYQASPTETVFGITPKYAETTRGLSDSLANVSTGTLQMSAEHGFGDALSLRVFSAYGMTQTDTANKNYPNASEGFGDIYLLADGFTPINSWHLTYGLQFGESPGISEHSTQNVVGNMYSGGQTLTPKLGLEIPAGNNWRLGPFTQYTLKGNASFETKNVSGAVTNSGYTTGGNTLVGGLFGEYRKRDAVYGSYFELEGIDGGQTNTGGTFTNYNSVKYAVGGIYGAFNINEACVLKPTIQYQSLISSANANGIENYSNSTLNFGIEFRMTL